MIYRSFAKISLAGFLLVSASGLTAVASAQTTNSQMNGLKLSNDQPIQIESDALEIREQEKKAFFTGNVKVVQGTTTLQAGAMTVLYRGEGTTVTQGNADIEKIDVTGKVFLQSETQQATADKGYFDMTKQVFVLEGERVVLSEGQNVFVGCKLTVQMNSGQAKLDSCGRRVQIQLDPKSQQSN
ncbi:MULTISPECIES: LptA/OstA family protein [Rhizobiaceae]|jgi:lipopolysaccharide export system protein LptA|uniref:LptA/OstA family protein n=1 Tax=Peteryoungia algae TaxID=2919917 RepID=A0ABT0CV86_9HYPH|nr:MULTISPECIES: LptA/OstA family protein [unclassified Rhizobium]MCC8931676.1 LptA/OstA family protein [Rhizobium sp. 'Codium 1']MCJ8237079.1 LptA/OstA family protein [Rhizobium sp. SSM4.3]